MWTRNDLKEQFKSPRYQSSGSQTVNRIDAVENDRELTQVDAKKREIALRSG